MEEALHSRVRLVTVLSPVRGFLLLVVRPGAPSSVLVLSSDAPSGEPFLTPGILCTCVVTVNKFVNSILYLSIAPKAVSLLGPFF